MLIDVDGVLHQCEIDVRYLEDVVVEIAFEDTEASALSNGVCSSFEVCFSGAVVEVETDEPGNVILCSAQL